MTEKQTSIEDLDRFVADGGIIIGGDVDTQFDFVDKKGALYAPAQPEVRKNLQALTRALAVKIGSVDSHAYDSPEFAENGGPFPAHCIKGEPGWMRIKETRLGKDKKPLKTRFIPMSAGPLSVGELKYGDGPRAYGAEEFAQEALAGIQLIFEKEVHAAWDNPLCDDYIAKLVEAAGGTRKVLFAVYGYCVGDYCADQFAEGLAKRGYQTAIVEDAVAPLNIGHDGKEQDGMAVMKKMAEENGIALLTTERVRQLLDPERAKSLKADLVALKKKGFQLVNVPFSFDTSIGDVIVKRKDDKENPDTISITTKDKLFVVTALGETPDDPNAPVCTSETLYTLKRLNSDGSVGDGVETTSTKRWKEAFYKLGKYNFKRTVSEKFTLDN